MWSLAGIIYNLSTAADLLTLYYDALLSVCVCVLVYITISFVLLYFSNLYRDYLPVRD